MDRLSKVYFEYEMMHYDDLTNKAKIPFQDIELDIASKYSGEDVWITKRLYDRHKDK